MLSCFFSCSHYPKPSDGALMKQIRKKRRLLIHGPDELQKVWSYHERDTKVMFVSLESGGIFDHRDGCLLSVLPPARSGR